MDKTIDVKKDALFLTSLAKQFPAYATEILKVIANYIQVALQANDSERVLAKEIEARQSIEARHANQKETIVSYQEEVAELYAKMEKQREELADARRSISISRTAFDRVAKEIVELKNQRAADAAKLAEYTVELCNTNPLTVGILIDSHRFRGEVIKNREERLERAQKTIDGLRQANDVLVTSNTDMYFRLGKVKEALKQ